MIFIKYPNNAFKIKQENGHELIFDEVRKKWIVLTPEEWVRQNFVQYLIEIKKYPKSLIAIEKEIKLGELKKRFDIVVYKDAKPWLLIECKEINVPINHNTLNQVLTYNQTLQVQYLVVTNGNNTVAINCSSKQYLQDLPNYN